MRCGAVDEPERHARIHRVDERALPFDEEKLASAALSLDDEPFGGAGEKVRDDGVDGDAPACNRDPRLSGRHEDGRVPASAGLEIELDRDRLLPDRAVRADGEDDARIDLEVRSGRHAEPLGRLAQVAQLHAARSCELRQLGVLGEELVQAALDVETCCDARLQEVAPRRREATSLGRDADDRDGRLVRKRIVDRADDRDPLVALSHPLRVEDRHDRIGPVADDPAHRLAVVRVMREALAEDEDASRAAHAD